MPRQGPRREPVPANPAHRCPFPRLGLPWLAAGRGRRVKVGLSRQDEDGSGTMMRDKGTETTEASIGTTPASAHLVRIPEAARITGLPRSLLRKSFMAEHKRPKNVPAPPPHKRIGRAVYILAHELPGWIESLGRPSANQAAEAKSRRGRPTVAERIQRRAQEAV